MPKGRAHPGVAAWASGVKEDSFYANVVIVMELERGVMGMERKDPEQGAVLRHWFENTFKPSMSGRILPITEDTAAICAAMHVPDKTPENDAWIAASAMQHNLTLVTRNTADFERTGVRLLNPFQTV